MSGRTLQPGRAEQVGLFAERIAYTERLVEGWVERGDVPCAAMLIARKGVVVSHRAFGRLAPEADAPPLQTDSLFPLASLTKAIVAACVMQLVEDGRFDLHEPIVKYIPAFAGEKRSLVTAHHLLTHTSGLRDEDVGKHARQMKEEGLVIPPADDTQHPAIQEQLYRGYGTPLANLPGQEMSYSSFGYTILGELVRLLSGQSLSAYAQQRIFEPLGMHDTFFVVPDTHFSRVVQRDDTCYGGRWYSSPNRMRMPSASGGVYSTVMDMARFGQLFLDQGMCGDTRILSPLTVRQMVQNQIPGVSAVRNGVTFREASWGYGWNVRSGKQDDSGSLRSALSFDHGGAGGIRLLMEPSCDMLWVYFSVETLHFFSKNLFSNAALSAVATIET